MEHRRGWLRRFFDAPHADASPAPTRGARRYFFLLTTHFGRLIGLSLLGTLLSLPVVTMPATLSAMDRVAGKLVRDGNCFFFSDFFEEWKKSFFKSLPLGLVFGGLCLLGWWQAATGLVNGGTAAGALLTAGGIVLLLLSAAAGAYAFLLCAFVSLPCGALLRDAWLLLFAGWKGSLCAVAAIAAFLAFTVLALPYSLLFDAVLLYGLLQFTLCFALNGSMQTFVLDPFTKASENEEEGQG